MALLMSAMCLLVMIERKNMHVTNQPDIMDINGLCLFMTLSPSLANPTRHLNKTHMRNDSEDAAGYSKDNHRCS